MLVICASGREQGSSSGSTGGDETLDSTVEIDEEREGNSGRGRGDKHRRDGETCWGVSCETARTTLSGRGGKAAMSLELKSGHAPGKEGVGEAATIVVKEEETSEKERCNE